MILFDAMILCSIYKLRWSGVSFSNTLKGKVTSRITPISKSVGFYEDKDSLYSTVIIKTPDQGQ